MSCSRRVAGIISKISAVTGFQEEQISHGYHTFMRVAGEFGAALREMGDSLAEHTQRCNICGRWVGQLGVCRNPECQRGRETWSGMTTDIARTLAEGDFENAASGSLQNVLLTQSLRATEGEFAHATPDTRQTLLDTLRLASSVPVPPYGIETALLAVGSELQRCSSTQTEQREISSMIDGTVDRLRTLGPPYSNTLKDQAREMLERFNDDPARRCVAARVLSRLSHGADLNSEQRDDYLLATVNPTPVSMLGAMSLMEDVAAQQAPGAPLNKAEERAQECFVGLAKSLGIDATLGTMQRNMITKMESMAAATGRCAALINGARSKNHEFATNCTRALCRLANRGSGDAQELILNEMLLAEGFSQRRRGISTESYELMRNNIRLNMEYIGRIRSRIEGLSDLSRQGQAITAASLVKILDTAYVRNANIPGGMRMNAAQLRSKAVREFGVEAPSLARMWLQDLLPPLTANQERNIAGRLLGRMRKMVT